MRYSNYSPTSSQAIGNVDRELLQMRKEAEKIRLKQLAGRLTIEEELAARQRFRGIFRPLLEDALKGIPLFPEKRKKGVSRDALF